MALDFLSIVVNGAYVTPTPTDEERASRAVSQGLLDEAPAPPVFDGDQSGGLNDVGTSTRL